MFRCVNFMTKFSIQADELMPIQIILFTKRYIIQFGDVSLTRGLRQMRGNIGKCIIFIIPSYRFFSKLNMFNNTPIITDEIGNVKNQQAYTIVVL